MLGHIPLLPVNSAMTRKCIVKHDRLE
uniref:Uncharacterized protein n=1 Tax=Anguilla anguilla TaxID=7936 RepID=A0A0E9V173_ANGAN